MTSFQYQMLCASWGIFLLMEVVQRDHNYLHFSLFCFLFAYVLWLFRLDFYGILNSGSNSFACSRYPSPSTGLPHPVWIQAFVCSLIASRYAMFTWYPGMLALFWREIEEQWIWGRCGGGNLRGVEGGDLLLGCNIWEKNKELICDWW